MKTSIIIPVFNEASNIPALLRSLERATRKSLQTEILFIDNGSTDGSQTLLEASKTKIMRVLSETQRGFAEPLNRGVKEARGELLLFLDADAFPDSRWVSAMEKALSSSDIVVGQTESLLPTDPSNYGKLAAKLFHGHSERTAQARGHALPWGPTCNLGVRKALFDETGLFSSEATSAFDIDWCWRALLKGAQIAFCKEAKVEHLRRNERYALLQQFERYGAGEAWLHKSYSFLLNPEDQSIDPLLAGVDAFRRLRHGSEASRAKSLLPVLEEVASAFAAGVRLGYDRPHRACRMVRAAPMKPIHWHSGKDTVTIFVPGKGLTELKGKPLAIWKAMQAGEDKAILTKRFMKLFRVNEQEALHELEHFAENLTP